MAMATFTLGNPYTANGIKRHRMVEEDDDGNYVTACGKRIHLRVTFSGGSQPELCPLCFQDELNA